MLVLSGIVKSSPERRKSFLCPMISTANMNIPLFLVNDATTDIASSLALSCRDLLWGNFDNRMSLSNARAMSSAYDMMRSPGGRGQTNTTDWAEDEDIDAGHSILVLLSLEVIGVVGSVAEHALTWFAGYDVVVQGALFIPAHTRCSNSGTDCMAHGRKLSR